MKLTDEILLANGFLHNGNCWFRWIDVNKNTAFWFYGAWYYQTEGYHTELCCKDVYFTTVEEFKEILHILKLDDMAENMILPEGVEAH